MMKQISNITNIVPYHCTLNIGWSIFSRSSQQHNIHAHRIVEEGFKRKESKNSGIFSGGEGGYLCVCVREGGTVAKGHFPQGKNTCNMGLNTGFNHLRK